jgi:hypothetical protein
MARCLQGIGAPVENLSEISLRVAQAAVSVRVLVLETSFGMAVAQSPPGKGQRCGAGLRATGRSLLTRDGSVRGRQREDATVLFNLGQSILRTPVQATEPTAQRCSRAARQR